MPGREIPLYRITGDPTKTPGVSGGDFVGVPARTGGSRGLGRNPISLSVLPLFVPDSSKPSGPNPPSYITTILPNPGNCGDGNLPPVCTVVADVMTNPGVKYYDLGTFCYDPEGGVLTVVSAVVDVGTLTLTGSVVEYVPPAGYFGPVVIDYVVRDVCTYTSSGRVNLVVQDAGCEGNVGPLCPAAARSAVTAVQSSYPVSTLCTDFEGDPITLLNASVDVGTVSVSGNNLLYTSPPAFVGSATITYTVADECTPTIGTLTVNVSAAENTCPETDGYVDSIQNGTQGVYDVVDFSSDPDSDPLSLVSASVDIGGTLATSGTEITFTPAVGWAGLSTISYTITDGTCEVSGSILVTVTVPQGGCVGNQAPVFDGLTTIPLCDGGDTDYWPVSDFVSDPEGYDLTVVSVSADVGTVSESGGLITYTKPSGFEGEATISLTVEDPCGAETAGSFAVACNCSECVDALSNTSWAIQAGVVTFTSYASDGSYMAASMKGGSALVRSFTAYPHAAPPSCTIRIAGFVPPTMLVQVLKGGYNVGGWLGPQSFTVDVSVDGFGSGLVIQCVGDFFQPPATVWATVIDTP